MDTDGARSRWLYGIFVGVRVHCSVLHRAIVGATNRPTGGKDARRLLAATISPIICALKQLHGNPVVPRPLSHDRPNSPTGGSGDIIISGSSPEHRINASGNVFIGLVSPLASRAILVSREFRDREFKNSCWPVHCSRPAQSFTHVSLVCLSELIIGGFVL